MTVNAILKGPEKWLAITEIRKKAKNEMKKIQTALVQRNFGLNSTSRSQYFVDKYPLIEKTREEREKITEERNALELKLRLIAAR